MDRKNLRTYASRGMLCALLEPDHSDAWAIWIWNAWNVLDRHGCGNLLKGLSVCAGRCKFVMNSRS